MTYWGDPLPNLAPDCIQQVRLCRLSFTADEERWLFAMAAKFLVPTTGTVKYVGPSLHR